MKKGLLKQERFSLRKMKVGLASVAILFVITKVVLVSTDETYTPGSSEQTKVTETIKETKETKEVKQIDLL